MTLRALVGENLSLSHHAYLRLSTPEDLRDAAYLLLTGVDVAIAPDPGFLTGFGRPYRLHFRKATLKGNVHHIEDTPEGIANGVLDLVTNKSTRMEGFGGSAGLAISLGSERLEPVIRGICGVLSQRAARPLSRTDIADIMGWVALLADARLDVQIPYGCEDWGAFVRGETHPTDLGSCPPPLGPNVTRTLVCHVKPTEADLERILAVGKVGIINGRKMHQYAPWAAGLSADKRLLMPSHSLAPLITWDPHDGGQEAPVLDRAALLEAEDVYDANWRLYGGPWQRGRDLAAEGYRMTLEPVPELLQPVWQHQRDGLHLHGLDIIRVPPCSPEDLRRHVLDAADKASRAAQAPLPQAVTTMRATSLEDHAAKLGVVVDHNAPVTIPTDENTARDLSAVWDRILSVEFRP